MLLKDAPVAIVITTYNEEGTIARAIEAAISQKTDRDYCVWVIVGGDDGTANIVRSYDDKLNIMIEERPMGKPNALNTIVDRVGERTDILVLTDGDVWIGPGTLDAMCPFFDDKGVGGVSGKLVPTNRPSSMFGFFARLSYSEINRQREKELGQYGSVSFATGYLFAIRRTAYTKIPKEVLVDDGYLSEGIHEKGLKLRYTNDADVHIGYPTNIRDFLLQKKRTRGGYVQLERIFGPRKAGTPERRSFGGEIRNYLLSSLGYVGSFREAMFLISFLTLSLVSWFQAFIEQRIFREKHGTVWRPVGSTKGV